MDVYCLFVTTAVSIFLLFAMEGNGDLRLKTAGDDVHEQWKNQTRSQNSVKFIKPVRKNVTDSTGEAASTTKKPTAEDLCHCSDKSKCSFLSVLGPTSCGHCEKGWKGDFCNMKIEDVPISKILLYALSLGGSLTLMAIAGGCTYHYVENRKKRQTEMRARLVEREFVPEFTDIPQIRQNNHTQQTADTNTPTSHPEVELKSGSIRNPVDIDNVQINVKEITLPSGQVLYF